MIRHKKLAVDKYNEWLSTNVSLEDRLVDCDKNLKKLEENGEQSKWYYRYWLVLKSLILSDFK